MYGTLQLPAMVRRGLRTLSRTQQDALGEVEAKLFEGREQVTAYSLVLGRALLEAEYVLVALVVECQAR